MHTMHIVKNILWYGSWVLIGITLGLLAHPVLASADVLINTLDNSSAGSVKIDQASTASADYFEAIMISPDQSMTINSMTFRLSPSGSSMSSGNIYAILSQITSTSSPGDMISGYMSDAQTLATFGTYATTTFTFATGVTIEAGEWWVLYWRNYDKAYSSSVGVNARTNTTVDSNFWYDALGVGHDMMWYRDWKDFRSYATTTYFDNIGVIVNGTLYSAPGGGGSASSTEFITGVSPVDGSYDVATTSYVNMSVTIPILTYEQADWKAKIACAEVKETTFFESLTDWGFSYTVDLLDEDCGSGLECTPHGVSYPVDNEIETDAIYNCTASLYKAKWYWFDTLIETQKFRFYTFSATSSANFAELIARADDLAGSVNVTGTSTNPVFGDCSILSGQISDCVIEPIKYLIIPSQTNRDDIRNLIDTTVFDKFPFSYIGLFNEEMASTTYYATTSAEFPDFSFETQNMNGVTTTITIFDGSQFVSAWSTVDEFDTLRTSIQYALVIMFTTILYFRVRRLIPSGDNVKGV